MNFYNKLFNSSTVKLLNFNRIFIMKKSVITIGTFDGVHKGHRTILNKTVKIAKENGLKSIVISFEKPVKRVSGLLTTKKEKLEILSSFCVDEILLFPVNEKIVSLTAEKFFEDILIKRLNVKHIVVGYDCTFGKDRAGNVAWLKKNVKKYDVTLTVIKPVKVNGKTVSSSKIRELLQKNDIDAVNKMSDRPFGFTGTHVCGNRIGRTLGFPTINLKVPADKLLPRGVFACSLTDKKFKVYYGVLNIGIRPTVKIKEHALSVEIHLLNFSGEWKEKHPVVYVHKFIRKERKFKTVESLKKSIQKDVDIAKMFFNIG